MGIPECRLGPDAEIAERLDVVLHKLMFTDAVPVFLYAGGGTDLKILLEALQYVKAEASDGGQARFALITGPQPLKELMRQGYALKQDGRVNANTQVVLMHLEAGATPGCEAVAQLVEDCAEMIHPGYFYFGGEGDRWLRLID